MIPATSVSTTLLMSSEFERNGHPKIEVPSAPRVTTVKMFPMISQRFIFNLLVLIGL